MTLTCTTDVVMNIGEHTLNPSLIEALCVAMYAIRDEIPFAIRVTGQPLPILSFDGDQMSGSDADLVALANLGSADRPPTAHPAHPADPVRLSLRRGKQQDDSDCTLQDALLTATQLAAAGGLSGRIQSTHGRQGETTILLEWQDRTISGQDDLARVVTAMCDTLIQQRRASTQIPVV